MVLGDVCVVNESMGCQDFSPEESLRHDMPHPSTHTPTSAFCVVDCQESVFVRGAMLELSPEEGE